MAVKYVFVTGGVVSGLGKGITAASLGRLLKARGYQVTMQKFDPGSDSSTTLAYGNGWLFSSISLPLTVCAEIPMDRNVLISTDKRVFIIW